MSDQPPTMPSSTGWGLAPDNTNTAPSSNSRSFLGSIRKLGRKGSNVSNRSTGSDHTPEPAPRRDLNPFSQSSNKARRSPSPLTNPTGQTTATRRPEPGVTTFPIPSNEPPPAYTATPTTPSAPAMIPTPSEPASDVLPAAMPSDTVHVVTADGGEDPYTFLSTFDTVLLVDDSGSMAGRGWREVSQALSTIAPIVTSHDADGIDIYFLNHKSVDQGAPAEGIAPTGYRTIKRAQSINEIFERVRPQGGTPTGVRVHHILKPYLAKYEKCVAAGQECKPLNLIVLTDGVPSDDVESVLISAAKKLDKFDAPPFQVGVQFFQVGNEEGAKEALEELDDELSSMVEGGIRDMVDTVTGDSSGGDMVLTGERILKCVLGAVNRRLDRRSASGSTRRER